MSDTPFSDSTFHMRVRASSTGLMWLGIAMAIIGAAALIFPMVSTLVAAILVGWVFLLSGVLMFLGAFSIHGTGPFFAALLFGLISVIAGVFLLFNPLSGAVALTLMVGIVFMFQGAYELFFAFEVRPHPGWIGMLIAGLASVLMAVLIAAGWPAVSMVVLGILLGVNFLSTGLGYIYVSRTMKSA